MNFDEIFENLNKQQREAVTTTEGPILVIAGPGTGKTQLLGTRAAHIVREGRAAAHNVLCLTYTDNGAVEMRNRLIQIMGPGGSDVAVHTFHGFGRWLVQQYPRAFSDTKAQRALDDLGRHRIFEQLMSSLPLRHPLAIRGEHDDFFYRPAVQKAIQAFKQAGLEPIDVQKVLEQNLIEYKQLEPLWDELFAATLNKKNLDKIATAVQAAQEKITAGSYSDILLASLMEAIATSELEGKTATLGAWRDKHLARENGKRILKSAQRHQNLLDMVDLYKKYQQLLEKGGLYDYDDMVLRAIRILRSNDDIRLDVAERFQYIMVDEFQDTSGAQNELLDTILRSHPTDAPNVLAVGDDDQAIMRFQGAELSGMIRFVAEYKPKIVVLVRNYRSGQAILNAAAQVIEQTEERLITQLPEIGLNKDLVAADNAPSAVISSKRFVSPSAQYMAIARQVKQLIDTKVPGNEIAIICSKHKELEAIAPYLEAVDIPISYDRQQTVLDDPHIMQLLDLAGAVVALSSSPQSVEAYLPRVLSAPYWELPSSAVYDVAVAAKLAKESWLETLLHSNDDHWVAIGQWLIGASKRVAYSNFTQLFDILVGRVPVEETSLKVSPFGVYLQRDSSEQYVRLLSHLICLRQTVLEARPEASSIKDLLEVCAEYRISGIRIIDSNPILRGSANSVQLLSGHGSKGSEFTHVFILSAVERVWGPKATGNNNDYPLPENIRIYPTGNTAADKLRLLYVAMTRAKSKLYLMSYAEDDKGKDVETLSFLSLGDDAASWWHFEDLPAIGSQDQLPILGTAWHGLGQPPARTLKEMLAPLMPRFNISPSVISSFINLKYGGPLACLEHNVLGFPSAYNEHSALGSAVHAVLERAQNAYVAGNPLNNQQLLEVFDEQLRNSGLSNEQLAGVKSHGHKFLPASVKELARKDFREITDTEKYLTAQLPGTTLPISGKLDALKVAADGRVTVIDYKTGNAPLNGWDTTGLADSKKLSLHGYRQQLLFYKILVENSLPFRGKQVKTAELIFVEPNPNNVGATRLVIDVFEPEELERLSLLIAAIYQHIQAGDMPDTSSYQSTLKDIVRFEDDLIAGTI